MVVKRFKTIWGEGTNTLLCETKSDLEQNSPNEIFSIFLLKTNIESGVFKLHPLPPLSALEACRGVPTSKFKDFNVAIYIVFLSKTPS